MQQGGEAVQIENQVPKWINRLLKKDFSECTAHEPRRNNYFSKYCITCDEEICKYCIRPDQHNNHSLIPIYRQMYQAVVHLREFRRLFDCAKIQSYKTNEKWVLYLTPLRPRPRNRSGAMTNGDGNCNGCERLTDPSRYCYCSIRCKVKAITGESGTPPEVPQVGTSQGGDESEATEEPLQPKSFRKRPRKGVPHRAPFF